jgi:hypothetical protein
MADKDASRGQHLLDHAQAQGKAEVQLDHMADHLSRKAVTGVLHPLPMSLYGHPMVNRTAPQEYVLRKASEA